MNKYFKILLGIALAVIVITVVLWQLPFMRYLDFGMHMDMQEVKFYGRVVDQYGQPVADAEVPFEIGGSAIGGYKGASKRITDVNGEFSIETEGSSLSFGRITHPDIEFGYPTLDRPGTWDYSHSSRLGVYGFQPQQGDNQVLWTDTSPEKPYFFKAWRIGSGEGEVAGSLIEGQIANMLDYNKTYTINFFKLGRDRYIEGEAEGQFKVIFHKEIDADGAILRWEAKIIPIDGGIQSTDDTYMNIAPLDGYQSEINITNEKPINETIHDLANLQYYFKSNNGKNYGSLFGKLKPRYEGVIISFTYKVNPDGERILVKGKEQ